MKPELEKILIIDDEASLRHMLRLVLEREGYSVSDAANGVEALTRLNQETFDLILCDVRMPEMDGLTFLREVSQRSPAPTVIMMSAYGTIDSAIACM